ncbi:hypothetical protein V8V91_08530 [Algoriphagus halophilus]|uniref:hypothetical protein n=1 Tax=Algoriphagus halophilus TaxID=226505 RepID=UPI00358E67DA
MNYPQFDPSLLTVIASKAKQSRYNWIASSFLLAMTVILLFSCKTPQVVTDTIRSDTTIIKEIPRLIEIPGDTLISQSINIDSLAALLRAGVPPSVIEKTTIREDPVTKNRVGILIDELGNLTALCEIQDQQIQLLEKEITRLSSIQTTTTITKPPGFFQRIKDAWDLLIITFFIILFVLHLIKKL